MGAAPEVENDYLKRCLRLVGDSRPDAIGISAWGVSLPFAVTFAKAAKEESPRVPIVLGGLQSGELAEFVLDQEPSIDAVVVGEGETTLAPLLRKMLGEGNDPMPPGISYRNGRVVSSGSPVVLKPAQWALPRFDTFLFPPGERFCFEASRGCSYSCIFCSVNNEPLRRRDPVVLVDSIVDFRRRYPFEYLSFTDNWFPLSGGWTARMCREIRNRLPGMRWGCCARADNICLETVQEMARAGCVGMFLGVESTSPETLRYIDKSKTPAAYSKYLFRNITAIAGAGVHVRVSTIVGFPHEGLAEMARTLEFVAQLIESGVSAYSGVANVYPGSRLWTMYRAGEIDVAPIHGMRRFRNYGGLFANRFLRSPWLVPNRFMPRHAFVPQDRLERFIDEWLLYIEGVRASICTEPRC
jgi:radical SAM superfamily enzyme YgiQ (UPF0313 family)